METKAQSTSDVAAGRDGLSLGYIPAGFGNASAHLLRLPHDPEDLNHVEERRRDRRQGARAVFRRPHSPAPVMLTILEGSTFCICDDRGDVGADSSGFFAHDTRFLSVFRLTVNGISINYTAVAGDTAATVATNLANGIVFNSGGSLTVRDCVVRRACQAAVVTLGESQQHQVAHVGDAGVALKLRFHRGLSGPGAYGLD